MADVDTALRSLELVGSRNIGSLKSLVGKQDLLLQLLENEQMRLVVWLYPLDHEKRHAFSSGHSGRIPLEVRWLFEYSLIV